jgi:hypothetical protein
MTGLARVAAALVGLFGLALGLWFFVKTPDAAAAFFVQPIGPAGQATLRADMSSFFLIGAAWAFYAAWTQRGVALLVPGALYSVAIAGRLVNLFVNGLFAGAVLPMIVEAMLILLCVLGYKALKPKA